MSSTTVLFDGTKPQTQPDDPSVRRYKLLRKIATGGMAEVFLARLRGAEGFERDVVVKRILPRWLNNPDVLSLFRDEARLGAQLDHPNIVQVLDYGRSGNTAYLVLEFVDGRNLADLLTTAQAGGEYLDAEAVAYVGAECCSALQHIHNRVGHAGERLDVVHRDLNPANVLVSFAGEVKLTDFGVAVGTHRELKTEHGILRGTFPYMSPEQTRCLPVDARSDLFALGVCLYEVLTTQHPFACPEDYDTIVKIQEHNPPPPSALRPDLDPMLDAVVLKCLAKEPGDRYESSTALRADLQGWLRTRRAAYGAGRVIRLMHRWFPEQTIRGEELENAEISLGPTRPKAPTPMLDVSRLDGRVAGGGPRPGGARARREAARVQVLEAPQESPPSGGMRSATPPESARSSPAPADAASSVQAHEEAAPAEALSKGGETARKLWDDKSAVLPPKKQVVRVGKGRAPWDGRPRVLQDGVVTARKGSGPDQGSWVYTALSAAVALAVAILLLRIFGS